MTNEGLGQRFIPFVIRHWTFVILVSSFVIFAAMPSRHTFPATRRLHGAAAFAAVYDGKVRTSRGPLTVYAIPNALGHPRLGLSVSRRVGNAIRRNRVKRLLRDAFRLLQHDLPAGYDLVVVVRPHAGLMLAEYQKLLMGAVVNLHNTWKKNPPPASHL